MFDHFAVELRIPSSSQQEIQALTTIRLRFSESNILSKCSMEKKFRMDNIFLFLSFDEVFLSTNQLLDVKRHEMALYIFDPCV